MKRTLTTAMMMDIVAMGRKVLTVESLIFSSTPVSMSWEHPFNGLFMVSDLSNEHTPGASRLMFSFQLRLCSVAASEPFTLRVSLGPLLSE